MENKSAETLQKSETSGSSAMGFTNKQKYKYVLILF